MLTIKDYLVFDIFPISYKPLILYYSFIKRSWSLLTFLLNWFPFSRIFIFNQQPTCQERRFLHLKNIRELNPSSELFISRFRTVRLSPSKAILFEKKFIAKLSQKWNKIKSKKTGFWRNKKNILSTRKNWKKVWYVPWKWSKHSFVSP